MKNVKLGDQFITKRVGDHLQGFVLTVTKIEGEGDDSNITLEIPSINNSVARKIKPIEIDARGWWINEYCDRVRFGR